MKQKVIIVFLTIVFFINSCQNRPESTSLEAPSLKILSTAQIKYAQGFKIEYFDGFKLLTIKNPWQGAKEVEFKYALSEFDSLLIDLPNDIIKIKTPVSKIICLSTTHIAFVDALKQIKSVAGISGNNYVCNKEIRKAIDNKKVFDVGYDNNLNYELVAHINPDLVATYGVGSKVAAYNQRMNELGIKTVIIAEYLENNPLGKLEWIKFVAAFYNLEEQADQYFNQVEHEYLELVKITEKQKNQPKVLFGLPWKEVWYVPGGKSYLAKMVEDAGGDYIWKDNNSHESLTLNFEAIFSRAANADIWLNTGSVHSKSDIIAMDERFEKFKPFNVAIIYNNNAIINSYGGIDYWESGIVNPHIILKDMISIFHPSLFPDYKLVYYKEIR